MKAIIITILVIASYTAMYLYANSICIPSEHTPGFCPGWIASGMAFPTFFWMFVAMFYTSTRP